METTDNNHFLSRGCKCNQQGYNRQVETLPQGSSKLDSVNWLSNIKPPSIFPEYNIVEVRFKNGRKDFFQTSPDLVLEVGDIVAVEASPGHDIGIVSLVGQAVRMQAKAKRVNLGSTDLKKAYRKAKAADIEKWITAVEQEHDTMLKSRQFASRLRLDMKISDVEYQGDRTKGIFYYTADDRVDFRELIRVFAEAFGVRVEMRQIGMRQEASRVGGIGTCGRQLCCSTWFTSFRTVSTNAARNQQLSLNPQKLAGQCSKLKCCINFENDCYVDYAKHLPENAQVLYTKTGKAILQKTEVLRGIMVYSYTDNGPQFVAVPIERVKEILELNKKNIYPNDLDSQAESSSNNDEEQNLSKSSADALLEDSLTRFDNNKKKKKKKKPNRPNHGA